MASRVLIIEVGGWGGICHYTYNLLEALARTNQAEAILLTDVDYELANLPVNFRIVKIPIKNQPYFKAIFRIISVIVKLKPNLIHIQSIISARKDWIIFVLARLLNKKVVFTAHNILPHERCERKAPGMNFAYKMIYGCSNKIIVHTQYSKNKLISLFRIAPKKIKLIYHGNYLFLRKEEISKEEAKKYLGIPQDKKIVLCFGTIRKYKGLDKVIGSFSEVKSKDKDAMLLIAGKAFNSNIGHYRAMIAKLNLDDCVILKDEYIPLGDIPYYFFAADVVVFAYEEIDASGSLQLAYAFSKPVIASKAGSFPEMIQAEQNGYLFNSSYIIDLVQNINKVLSNEVKAKEMGDCSFKFANEKFNWQEIASETDKLYKSLTR